MPRFAPFAGLRYATHGEDLDDRIAPPYDIVGPEERARLAARHPANAIHVELPVEGDDGTDKYTHAARLLAAWTADGTLVRDSAPAFYLYRMTTTDERDQTRTTTGVLGGLELVQGGDVLPHEQTIPKDRADRLSILQATRTNLSPIWGMSMTPGLGELLRPEGPAQVKATDDDGVVHELWVLDHPEGVAAIEAAVAKTPVVIADGHHRFEVGNAYLETRADDPGAELILCFVVELAAAALDVRAIHRHVRGVGATALAASLAAWFDVEPFDGDDSALLAAMEARGGAGLLGADGRWFLDPKPSVDEGLEHGLDTERWEKARAGLPDHEVAFRPGIAEARAALTDGRADAVVLVRPVTVEQIRRSGEARARMPQKSTFFWPKPRTGMVFRTLD